MKALTAIGLGAIVVFAIPVAVGWYVYRGAQWERRGFRGHYEQPVEAWRRAGVL